MVKINKLSRIIKRWEFQLRHYKQLFNQAFNGTVTQSQERGSILVLVTLALTALLGFCAIVTDVGVLYAKKFHLQNSVNAAALAGAQELMENFTQAEHQARDYANKNGVAAVTVSFGANNAKITVQASQQVPTYFARIWGIAEKQIAVTAKAMTVPVTAMTGAVPLCILEQALVYGETYEIKVGAGSGTNGWYGTLDLGDSGGGASEFKNSLTNGSPENLIIGQSVYTKTGNQAGPVKDAIKNRLSNPRSLLNTFEDHGSDAPQLMFFPVVIPDGSDKVKILAFAAFWIDTLVDGGGSDSVIFGRFLRQVASNATTNASLSDLLGIEYEMEQGGVISSDYGVYTVKLVK